VTSAPVTHRALPAGDEWRRGEATCTTQPLPGPRYTRPLPRKESMGTTQTESRNDRAETKQVRQDIEELAFGVTGSDRPPSTESVAAVRDGDSVPALSTSVRARAKTGDGDRAALVAPTSPKRRQVSIPEPEPEPQNASVSALAGRPRLLMFGSTRSGQSRRVEGFLAQVLQRRHNHATFLVHHIDAETRPELARRFAVEQLPTIIVFENGGVRARCEQPRGCVEIATALAPWLR
jgi:hypothetical protein